MYAGTDFLLKDLVWVLILIIEKQETSQDHGLLLQCEKGNHSFWNVEIKISPITNWIKPSMRAKLSAYKNKQTKLILAMLREDKE